MRLYTFEGGCRPLPVTSWYCEVIIVPCHGKMGRLICHETTRTEINDRARGKR